jgi:hypothetical protein
MANKKWIDVDYDGGADEDGWHEIKLFLTVDVESDEKGHLAAKVRGIEVVYVDETFKGFSLVEEAIKQLTYRARYETLELIKKLAPVLKGHFVIRLDDCEPKWCVETLRTFEFIDFMGAYDKACYMDFEVHEFTEEGLIEYAKGIPTEQGADDAKYRKLGELILEALEK